MRRITAIFATAALAVTMGTAGVAHGQLLGGLPTGPALGQTLGQTLGQPLGGALGPVLGDQGAEQQQQPGAVFAPLDTLRTAVGNVSPSSLLSLRRDRLRTLVRSNRKLLDMDDDGNPIRRNIVVGIDLSPASLAAAAAAGFRIVDTATIAPLGLVTTTFETPGGAPARKALPKLQAADPTGSYALDPIYQPAGEAFVAASGAALRGGGASDATIGLIDGGVGAHPAFAGARVEQRGFAGAVRPSGHGTAVASLLVGRAGAFHGAATGDQLLVADVYGGSAANGSAAAIVRAMGWLAERHVRVINISLVGPANPLLAAGIRGLAARGIAVVAAVGNDGPAAPPQYPASYPGVVAVTGVDDHDRALIEAGRATHLDFAAPGADMVGAVPGGGWERLRGTSFAAPFVAARLVARGSLAALATEAKPGKGRVGRGVVCGDCAIAPSAVGLKK